MKRKLAAALAAILLITSAAVPGSYVHAEGEHVQTEENGNEQGKNTSGESGENGPSGQEDEEQGNEKQDPNQPGAPGNGQEASSEKESDTVESGQNGQGGQPSGQTGTEPGSETEPGSAGTESAETEEASDDLLTAESQNLEVSLFADGKYEVKTAEDLTKALGEIEKTQDNAAVIELTANISGKEPFAGVSGKQVTVKSAEGQTYSLNVASELEGDITFQNVELVMDNYKGGHLAANGHTVVLSEGCKTGGRIDYPVGGIEKDGIAYIGLSSVWDISEAPEINEFYAGDTFTEGKAIFAMLKGVSDYVFESYYTDENEELVYSYVEGK